MAQGGHGLCLCLVSSWRSHLESASVCKEPNGTRGGMIPPMLSMHDLATLLVRLQAEVQHQQALITRQAQDTVFKQATIDKLTHENAVLQRLKFAAHSERFNAEQRSLLEKTLDADLEAAARDGGAGANRLHRARARATPTQAGTAAGEIAAPRNPSRTREHHLRVRLPDIRRRLERSHSLR